MRLKRSALGALLILPLLGAPPALAAANIPAHFKLTRPVSAARFISSIQNSGAAVNDLVLEVNVGGRPYRFGITGKNVSVSDLEIEAQRSLADLAGEPASRSGVVMSKDLPEVRQSLTRGLFKIVDAQGVGLVSAQPFLSTSNRPSSATAVSHRIKGVKRAAALTGSQAAACGIWRPNFHSNIALPSSFAGNRYDTLKFAFTAGQLSALACTGSTTFEPDLVTNNYDTLSYLGVAVAWTSNMPGAYLDTTLWDSPDEHVYTVGAKDNSLLDPYTEYSNYIRTTLGNSGGDTAKVVWQRGHEFIWGCNVVTFQNPQFCTVADESKVEYVWAIILPGTWTPN